MTDDERAPIAPEPEPEQFYTPEEVAGLFRLTTRTIKEWIRDGKIEAVKVGGSRLRIPKSEVLRLGNKHFG